MPRNYIRKRPDLAPVTQEQMLKAKTLIAEGKSKRAAAKAVGISDCCLGKRLKCDNYVTRMGRFKPTFSEAQEMELAIHCKQINDKFFGLTRNHLKRLAFEYATANNIENRFDKSSKMAGRDWVEGFLKRNPKLVKRQYLATSKRGFNKVQVNHFYINLKELYEKYKFEPSRIYNVDETGISTVPKKSPKVLATKGKKASKIVSAEKGITITAICCMSASGHYIPPALIYPRKRPRGDLLDGGPSQSVFMVSDSECVTTEHFTNWLHHFKYFVHATQEHPVLLILDNHSSHISLEAMKYARENNIVMLTLPPHGNNKLQPLDRCLFGQLKTNYAIECDEFMAQHPGRSVCQYQVARLFNQAYKKVATLENAESGFKVTGIYPYDDDVLDEADFAPSTVTDQLQDRDGEKPVEERQPISSEAQNTNNPRDVRSNDNPDHSAAINMSPEIDISQIEFDRIKSLVKIEMPEFCVTIDDTKDDIALSTSVVVAKLEMDHGSEENMDNDDTSKNSDPINENFETTNSETSSIESPVTLDSSDVASENRSGISKYNIEEVNIACQLLSLLL